MLVRFNRIKYYISHAPLYIQDMVDLDRLRKTVGFRFFGYLSNVIMMIALLLGLYTRWQHEQQLGIALMAFSGLFIYAISCALTYYFSMDSLGSSLMRLWIGCLLGVIAFTNMEGLDSTQQQVMEILLLTSLGVHCFWNVLERAMRMVDYQPKLLDKMDCLEMLGFSMASLVCGKDGKVFAAISLLMIAFALVIIAIELKSFLSLIILLVLVIIASLVFFPNLKLSTIEPFALGTFAVRMTFVPVIDLYFSVLTTLERWQIILCRHSFVRRLGIFLISLLELTFIIVNAVLIVHHKEWYIVVPFFAALSLVWASYHMVFVISCWLLNNKMTLCNTAKHGLGDEDRSLSQILSAQGVRHFSLITQRLVLVALVTTVVIVGLGWITKTEFSISILFMILPIEAAIVSLLWELGSVLGGTIIGYALVAPTVQQRSDQGPILLTTNALQEMSQKSTLLLNAIQRFFSFHLIETFGCDYSTSGVSLESVEAKLRALFQQMTSGGPKYDTYLVYYSGEVTSTGDWALTGNETFKLMRLVEIWREENGTSGARLILLLDTHHSDCWLRDVRRLPDDLIAIQTCKITKRPSEVEAGVEGARGDFTTDWIDYNCGDESKVQWGDKERPVKALYAMSRAWPDFVFHSPTEDDIAQHWDANFPKVTKPLIKITNFPQLGSLCFCLDCVVSCFKRMRMRWLPPAECDTGHGFKLVRSS